MKKLKEDKRVSNNLKILFAIIKNNPTSSYKLSKILPEFNYTYIQKVVIDLEYLGLIATRVHLTDKNRVEKMVFIPDDIIKDIKKLLESKKWLTI